MLHIPAFESRDYKIFWIGQFVSLIGTWMQSTVQPYLAYQLTGQPIYLGLIGFASTIPTLLISLPAGVIVERMDKRMVTIAMQAVMLLQALAMGLLALLGWLTIWHIAVLSFVLGAANAVEITTRQAMIPELVTRAQLPSALALNATAFNLARVIGPVLAAPFLLLVAGGGEGWAFIANAVSYLCVIASLFMIRPARAAETPAESAAAAAAHDGVRGAVDAFRAGQDYIRHTGVILLLIIMSAVVGTFGFTAAQLIPVYARDVLALVDEPAGAAATRNSAMVAALGAGAFLASIVLIWLDRFKRKGLLLAIGQLVYGAAILLNGFSRSFPLTLFCLALAGYGQVTSLNLTNQIIQLTTPNSLRARVFSTYLWALQGVTPFGSLLVGWVAQQYSAPAALVLCGAACLLSPLIVHARTGRIRDFRIDDGAAR